MAVFNGKTQTPQHAMLSNSVGGGKCSPFDLDQVISADADTVIIWNIETGSQIFSFCLRHLLGDDDDSLISLSFDTGERRLLAGTRQGQLWLLNYINGQLLREFPQQPQEIVHALHVVNSAQAVRYIATACANQVGLFEDNTFQVI